MPVGRIFRWFFFSNCFYGVCAVALSAETFLQSGVSFKQPFFYLLVFAGTVFYYTLAYLKTENKQVAENPRVLWYAANRKAVVIMQAVLLAGVLAACIVLTTQQAHAVFSMPWYVYLACVVMLVCAALYYGSFTGFSSFRLRNIGWLKPFCIAYTWTVLVTLCPAMYITVTHGTTLNAGWQLMAHFINNFLFVATLCIMFDIKDYAMDYNHKLKTFVVKFGLRKTIRYILLPMSLAGLFTCLLYAFGQQVSPAKLVLNALPYLAVIGIATSLHKRKGIFYYLVVIDGLMLFKAICGSVSAL